MPLESVIGNLRALSKLGKGTFQHADQLQAERQGNQELRMQHFYTADGNGYFPRRDGGVDWAITREAENLVLRHLDDRFYCSYTQLVRTGNYHSVGAEAIAARNAGGTVVVDMAKLRLEPGTDNELCYLNVRTEDGFIKTRDGYQAPNEEELKAMTRLGFTSGTLKMLCESEPKRIGTKISVLDPEYVRKVVKNKPESMSLWRASWLGGFGNNSIFVAYDRDIDKDGRLRGLVRASEASTKD